MRRDVIGYGPVLVLIAGAVVIAYLILSSVIGGSGKYVVYAKFQDAGGVLKNYTVKVNNVTAGSVEKISLDARDNVVVRMELDEGAAPIGPGATAKVRPVNLLGEKYIDLDAGDQSRALPSGSTIGIRDTSTPTELDDLLNVLDPQTRAGLRILVNEAGEALGGRGANFNAVLEELPPALDKAREFVGEIARENQTLDRLIVRGDRILESVHSKRDDFGDLVSSAADTLDVFADRRARLGQTVRAAPSGLGQLTGTLGRVQRAADQLAPAARDLRETAPALATTLGRTPAFARDAQGTLTAAREVAPALTRLGRQSTPTLKRLRPTAERLAEFARGAQALLDAADTSKGLRHFLGFMQGWVGVIENADGLGHVFRLRLTFDEEFFTSAINRYLAAFGPKSEARSKNKARQPHGTRRPEQSTDRLLDALRRQLPKVPLPRLTEGLKQLPSQIEKQAQDVLGALSGKQPRSGSSPSSSNDTAPLLDFLLGS